MKPIQLIFDKTRSIFEKGGRLHKLHPLFEAIESFFYLPNTTTDGSPHVRDSMDLKRLMGVVVLALFPCVFVAMLNTGYQANLALEAAGASAIPGWRGALLAMVGIGCQSGSLFANLAHGAAYFLPVYIVTMTVGGLWEVLFSCVRRHEVAEGFFVTGLLFPLILPPAIPLWQVAVGISFGVVMAKELFGGTGRNFLNPALAARAYVFFAYPAQLSGDKVWVAFQGVDGFTQATPLAAARDAQLSVGMGAVDCTWMEAFLGSIPGSMGETSTLACLIGAAILIATGIGSWRIMLAMLIGGFATALMFFVIGSDTNAMFQMPPHWHLVTGGFAFGLVFMATDPVSASQTDIGRWIYGFLIGAVCILIRVVNPAYAEGAMLAILLGNVFSPIIDYCVIESNVKKRMARNGA
jgi:Na+-transporting NADH:ubiquinone oxidoreductase subunit B